MKRGILFLALTAMLLARPARAAMLPDGSPMDRFANLTEAEREQIYALSDRFCEAACSLLEKYAELGVLGSETAGKICRDLREHLKLAQQDQQPFGLEETKSGPRLGVQSPNSSLAACRFSRARARRF